HENPICTLGDYSKSSHKGYRDTIELPEGNNVVPLRSDTIQLVQNRCSVHGLWSEEPNQHLKDFLKLVDSLDLDVANSERTHLRLFQFSLCDQASKWLERLPAGSISTWEDLTTCFLAQFFPPGRTAKLRNDILMFQQHQGESLSEVWTRFKDLLPHHGTNLWLQCKECLVTIKKLAQYEDEGWNDPVIPEEGSLDYKNPDIEQLLRVMEYKVDTLMKDAISLIGRSESVFGMRSNEMYQLRPEPSRQKEFEHIVTNFILDQEERVKQLEEYMKMILGDFRQLSLEVTRRLKENMRDDGSRMRKIKKITKYPNIKVLEPLAGHEFSENPAKKVFPNTPKSIPTNSLYIGYVHPIRPIHFGDVIDWELLTSQGLDPAFFESINTDPFFGPQWVNLFQINEHVYREFVREFFASFEFDSSPCRYDLEYLGVKFRIGGKQKENFLLELGWRVSLYTKRKSKENETLSGLSRAEMVMATHLLREFWPSIGDGEYAIRITKVTTIRDPRVKLAHRYIATTIAGRKETTHRVTEIDLYYLYCIYTQGVVCNIPCWLAK
ncbi:zinc finger, CCHC-type containing protein, partial [Tanacetum coccineum]